jgi:transposase
MSERIEAIVAPFAEARTRLDTIPGIDQRTAEVPIAEFGVDMRVFPTAGHVASGARLCPGNNESAGKTKVGQDPQGYSRWLRAALIEAALAAILTRDCAFGARYRRVLRDRAHKRAVVAVAHAMLVTAYHLLARGTVYQEPGADYYTRRDADRIRRRPV